MLPRPNESFRIPSLHDSLPLDCRIYYPSRQFRASGPNAAIIAHPYAPLGGSYDDPVVGIIGRTLLSYGYVLVTFNFRGARGSAGRTSWTAKPELQDYVSVYVLALTFLEHVRQTADLSPSARAILIMAGYSYGSMITSYLPAPRDVLAVSRGQTKNPTALKNIIGTGTELSSQFVEHGLLDKRTGTSASTDQEASDTAGTSSIHQNGSIAIRSPTEATAVEIPLNSNASPHAPDTAYLLISPILGVSASLARAFQPLGSATGATMSSGQDEIQPNLITYPSCAVYGDADTFTSKTKLRKWAENLKKVDGSWFTSSEVTAVGHFWSEEGADVKLKDCISSWLRELRKPKSG